MEKKDKKIPNPVRNKFLSPVRSETSNGISGANGVNILIANSSKETPLLLSNLFSELARKEYFFYFLLAQADSELKNCGKIKKMHFGPAARGSFGFWLFLLTYPFLLFGYFFFLLYFKYRKNIKTLVCLNWNEKIIFTPLAVFLRVKVIWLEPPEINYKKMPAGLLLLFRFFSRWATIVAFVNFAGMQLKNIGVPANRIKITAPGIKLNQPGQQQNIFSNLAKAEKSNFSRKYFTLGVVTDFVSPHQIENLFQAVKTCLAVISNLQLIIVGEGRKTVKDKGKKRLDWLAKKIGIDNLVWFVSEQDNLRKWLDSFDVFVITSEISNLSNLSIVLKTMSVGLPIIGFRNRGFEDLILEDKSGVLIEAGNSEILAGKIIELYKNKRLGSNLGKNARELAENSFTLEKMAEAMEEILK